MSIETVSNNSERTWSYSTPYDLVDRAKIIAEEGERSPRVVDMDNYVHYINHEMPAGYMASTQMDVDPNDNHERDDYENERITIYHRDKTGNYVPSGRTDTYCEFMGDKVVINGDNVLVFNTNEDVGAIAHRHIKLININPDDPDSRSSGRVSYFKSRIGGVLYRLANGNRYF